eukprot:352575-Chlamydomonas_euryale.AAC.3
MRGQAQPPGSACSPYRMLLLADPLEQLIDTPPALFAAHINAVAWARQRPAIAVPPEGVGAKACVAAKRAHATHAYAGLGPCKVTAAHRAAACHLAVPLHAQKHVFVAHDARRSLYARLWSGHDAGLCESGRDRGKLSSLVRRDREESDREDREDSPALLGGIGRKGEGGGEKEEGGRAWGMRHSCKKAKQVAIRRLGPHLPRSGPVVRTACGARARQR